MIKNYKYRFHPLILCTNRQVQAEASHVLYIENLLVRVRSSGPSLKAWVFGGAGEKYAVPILASGEQGKQFKNHVMEILIQDRFHHSLDNCFIISSDDMPRFCWAFVMKSDKSYEFLALFTLAVEIRQDLNGSNLLKKAYMDTQKKP